MPTCQMITIRYVVLLFIVSQYVAGTRRGSSSRYGIVIDAGSSGSRVYVYQWPASGGGSELRSVSQKTDENGKVISRKITPGLSSFSQSPGKAYSSLVPLLEYASNHVPVSLHKMTEVHVLATAGMRLLPQDSSLAIMAAVCKGIKSNYSFQVKADHVKVISGQMEGLFGWIALNYILGRLSMSSPVSGQQLETYGFIEMGGASEQIAYEVDSETALPPLLGRTVELCPQGTPGSCLSYQLYVTTFLSYGANSALSNYFKLLLSGQKKSQKKRGVVSKRDPCQPNGLDVDIKLVGSKVKVLSVGGDKKPAAAADMRVTGDGDFAACRKKLRPLLLGSENSSVSIGGTYQPSLPLSRKFFGFSEYWYCMEDVLGIGGHYSYKKFLKSNQKYCSTEWSELKRMKKSKKFPKADFGRLWRQCFKAAWLAAVLHDGHHFPEDFDLFESVMEVKGTEVQWTLGAMVYLLHQPTQYYPSPVAESSYMYPSLLFTSHARLWGLAAGVGVLLLIKVLSKRRLAQCPW